MLRENGVVASQMAPSQLNSRTNGDFHVAAPECIIVLVLIFIYKRRQKTATRSFCPGATAEPPRATGGACGGQRRRCLAAYCLQDVGYDVESRTAVDLSRPSQQQSILTLFLGAIISTSWLFCYL